MIDASLSPWPSYDEDEINAVTSVLRSNKVNYWTGEECRLFEAEFASWAKTAKAIAVTNGTVALDLALNALGIGPGDEVIVTPRTFIASASCVVTAGAKPVFADIDIDSGNLSATTIERCITSRTKAVIPVHLAGWPCDLDSIMELAKRYDFAVIEDCAQAHGAEIGGRPVGSIGHIGAWSFCQDKIMTTGGEGGMITTNDDELWSKMWSYKDHGKSWDAVYNREHAPGYRWLHESFGTNWRMLEMQAAIGRLQLKKMQEWTARRTYIAERLAKALCAFPEIVRVPMPNASVTHAYYRLYAYIQPENIASLWSRDRIIDEFCRNGLPVFQGSCSEVYLERAFEGTDFRPSQRLPNALQLGQTSLMFLTHPTISDSELDGMCVAIDRVLRSIS